MGDEPSVDDLSRLLVQLRDLRELHRTARESRGQVGRSISEVWSGDGDLVSSLVDEMMVDDGIDHEQRISQLEFVIGQLRAQTIESDGDLTDLPDLTDLTDLHD